MCGIYVLYTVFYVAKLAVVANFINVKGQGSGGRKGISIRDRDKSPALT